jgi:type IV pilus assembly protein PilQ
MAVAASLASPGVQAQLGGSRPPAPPSSLSAAQQGPVRRYTGTPIDIDFQGADLRMVLRQLAEIGGLNLVIDPSVPANARVDVKLTQVPWDQALDVVLKNSQLAPEIDGTVVRVVTLKAMNDENEARKKLQDSQAETQARENVKPQAFSLNYAKGIDVEKMLNSPGMLGKYAKAQFDERTNTIIITGLPSDFELATNLIKQLDQPEPQVEIEARIVQTNRDSAKALGVQWGFNGRMSPALGNTTNLAFPNSGSATGAAGDPTKVKPGTAVNLPVVGSTSGAALSMGAVNGAFNLDVALTALEHQGKVKILSTPRVTTQNNKEAQMAQGFEVPFQTTSNNTTTIQFKDAALKLTVTPHITGANTVIMEVLLENGAPDFSRAVNGNPSINTQRASTKVQVSDGVTTVIGGILSTTETSNIDSTPGASRIPLLGWLFKRNDNSSASQELLIFITPRIIR